MYIVTLLDKKRIAENVYELTFHLDNNLRLLFYPGQYVWLELMNMPTTDSRGTRRAFSIITSPKNTESFSILLKGSDSAYKRVVLSMPVGTKVRMSGPHGSAFMIDKDTPDEIVLVAGGAGIAPFLSIIRSLFLFPNRKFILVHSVSSKDHTLYEEEIVASEQLKFHKHIGYLHDDSFPSYINYSKAVFFVCGSADFVNAAYKILQRRKVPNTHIKFEQNYPTFPYNLTEDYFNQATGDKSVLIQALKDAYYHMIITDANGNIIFANAKSQSITGFTFDEMRGNTPRLWGGMMTPEFYKDFWKKKASPEGFEGEITNRRKNGELYHVISHISPILTKDKTIIGFIATEEDITSKVNYERMLQQQNKMISDYKSMLEAVITKIPDGIIVIDTNKKVILLNQAAIDILGVQSVNYMNTDFVKLCNFAYESDQLRIDSEGLLNQIYTDEKYREMSQNVYVVKPDSTKIPIAYKAIPNYGSEREFIGMVFMFHKL